MIQEVPLVNLYQISCYVPGNVLGTRNIVVNRKKLLSLRRLYYNGENLKINK